MKIKSKLILAAAMATVVSAAAVGTSTFAWYTAVRNRQLSITSMTASGLTGDLAVYLSDGNTGDVTSTVTTEAGAANSLTMSSENTLTDATTAGNATFAKPLISTDGTKFDGWYTESGYTPSTVKWYHKYILTFVNTGDVAVNLYLSQKTTIATICTDATTSALVADSVRYSFTTDGTAFTYVNPLGAAAENKYLPASTAAGTAIATAALADVTSAKKINTSYFGQTADITTNPANLSTYAGFIGVVPAKSGSNGKLAVTFYTWIEGTDSNTVTANLVNGGGSFNLVTDFFSLAA